jgi:uncharacterized protein (TIGR00251 family)
VTLQVVESEEGAAFRVRVTPRSGRDEIVGLHGDALKIKLAAAPEKGRANRALQKLLADRLGVSPSAVQILSGHLSRQKRVCVTGVTAGAVRDLLGTDRL